MGGYFKTLTMTDKDKQLIAQARQLGYTRSDEALALAEKADTEEAREELRRIAVDLHHRYEAATDCI